MKSSMTLALAALLVSAGAAAADQPVVLTDSQLDRVTAGTDLPQENITLNFSKIEAAVRGEISLTFVEGRLDEILIGLSHPAGSVERTLPAVGKR